MVLNDEATTTETTAGQMPSDSRHYGFIREWHAGGKGFGKIYARLPEAEKGEFFFFHVSSVKNVWALAKGVKVRFDIAAIQSGKHRRAVNVEVVG